MQELSLLSVIVVEEKLVLVPPQQLKFHPEIRSSRKTKFLKYHHLHFKKIFF